jgi:hypothetical protein
MDQQLKVIKRIEPLPCPHCGKDVLVGVRGTLPEVSQLITKEDVDKAKMDLLERLEKIEFISDDEKIEVLRWINDENTLMDGDDVDAIEKNIAHEQTQKISIKNNEQQQ